MTSEVISRGEAVQPHYGRTQANRLGSLPTGISSWINGTEVVNDTYGRLETEAERKAFFDEFLKVQRAGFSSAWVAIYQTVDLMRQNDWYWQSAGFDSFDVFWQDQGQALFGQWAELEATYQYAHMAAPQLFEVDYDEAKAIAQQLAPFRGVPAATTHGGADRGQGRKNQKRSGALDSPINPSDYLAEVNGADWQEGYKAGKNAKSGPGEDRYRRFARLRRDAADVADRFLAGEFIKRCKNGTILPDLVAAEVEAGIRAKDQPARQRDALAYCKQLSDNLTLDQLLQLQQYITQRIEVQS